MKRDEFKFEHCANYPYGCKNLPSAKIAHKEYCLDCFAKIKYDELTYAIKHGKYKNAFKLVRNSGAVPFINAFEERKKD